MKKFICYLLLIAFLFAPISTAHSINVKTRGKLALAVLLSGVAILTKYLVDRDPRAIEDLHAKLGPPDRVIEFERGFDYWRIEWYGHRQYIFRNQVLQKVEGNEQIRK
ncbi:hypothetical protein HYR99_40930 [Candidatus Poribacteria bacterium]|nr:hypothetical protein [Candidatus Poribacteria bacterium]